MRSLLILAFCLGFCSVTFGFIPSKASFVQRTALSAEDSGSRQLSESNYNKIYIAGGSRGVGRSIIDKLVASGCEIVALVRSDEAAEELSSINGVTAIKGDAFDYKAVEDSMYGCDAVISTLGGQTDDGKRVDYEGNSNVIEAAGILGLTRVVLVTSIGCGSSKEAAPPAVFEVLSDVLAAKERAENLLIKYYTNTNWTIIRPGGLKTEKMTGTAILTESTNAIGSIHREDVADLVVKVLASKNTEKKILSAFDPSISAAANVEGVKYEAFPLS